MELPKWKGKINKLWQLICGNGIAKMGGKKNCANWFVAMLLPKWKGKKKCDNWLCFLELPKWEGKKRIMVMKLLKIGGERERERERENCLDKKYIYLEESITSSLPPDSYSPKYLEYILYSFPIKPNLLISHIESMLWILFCLFISLFVIKGRHHH